MSSPVPASAPQDLYATSAALRRLAGEQRAVVRWWAAECRACNARCRARFSTANVAAATEARRTLRVYAEAWSATRAQLRACEAALAGLAVPS